VGEEREPEQLCQVNQATLPDADACMWSLLARWVANLAMHGDASQHQHQCKCRACAQLTHCVEIGTMQLHSDKPTAFHFTAATTMNHESESKHPSADGVSCDAAERKPMPGQWKSGGDADGPVSSLKHARA